MIANNSLPKVVEMKRRNFENGLHVYLYLTFSLKVMHFRNSALWCYTCAYCIDLRIFFPTLNSVLYPVFDHLYLSAQIRPLGLLMILGCYVHNMKRPSLIYWPGLLTVLGCAC